MSDTRILINRLREAGFAAASVRQAIGGVVAVAGLATLADGSTVFAKTLLYSYLFGLLPALMIGAVDDIVFHIKRIGPLLRSLIVGVMAFAATEVMYGSRGPDTGLLQFVLYGLGGFVPGVVSSLVAHYLVDRRAQALPA